MSINPPSPPLTSFDDAPHSAAVNLLFIHHSVGGQLLADPGPLETTAEARRSLHRTHPNGGGLRSLLSKQGYRVHEASYGSAVGRNTDLFDWLPKFRDSMPQVLAIEHQDDRLASGENQIVLFKSCYPNNAFNPAQEPDEGSAAGDARGPVLTLANAKATLRAVRDELAKYPRTLFVYLSAPPLRAGPGEPAWKSFAKRLLRRATLAQEQFAAARLAGDFNEWVMSPAGWLADYPHGNILCFDYFGLLMGLADAGSDNHPDSRAQTTAARELASMLERARSNACVSA
jgi:hypothetical protein